MQLNPEGILNNSMSSEKAALDKMSTRKTRNKNSDIDEVKNLFRCCHMNFDLTFFTLVFSCECWRNRPLEKSAPREIGPKTLGIEILEKSSLLSNFTYIDVAFSENIVSI